MNFFRLLCTSLGVVLFGACATRPLYRNVDPGLPHAVAQGSGQFSFSGAVGINRVDGIMVPRPMDAKRISPGQHRLQLNASMPRNLALGEMEVDFQAGRKYLFRSKWDGSGFIVTLFDVTVPSQETLLKTTRLTELSPAPSRTISIPVIAN